MNTAEDFIILQGHVYQHNKKIFDNRTLQTQLVGIGTLSYTDLSFITLTLFQSRRIVHDRT